MAERTGVDEQLEPIVDEWVEFARTSVPLPHEFTREELGDHARVLLLAISAEIQQAQGAKQKHDKSQGNNPENAPEVTRMRATMPRGALNRASPSITWSPSSARSVPRSFADGRSSSINRIRTTSTT